jgi:type IV pilus assembly protein PilB
MTTQHATLGDVLVKAGVVDAVSLARAVEAGADRPATLGRILAGLGLADEAVVARTIAAALHLDYHDVKPSATPELMAVLSLEFCRKRRTFPIALEGRHLRVAVSDPLDLSLLQDLAFRTGKKVTAALVTETWLDEALGIATADTPPADAPAAERASSNTYDLLREVEPAGEVEAATEREQELIDPALLAKDTNLPPIVRLVNLILSDAAAAGASDIHIEPQESCLKVRQRVDGLLREQLTVPPHLQDQTISRFKIISGMDIAERRKPQDGRSRLRFQGKRIDLRVSSLPTQFGEKIVIRLLNTDRAIPPLDKLGFSPANLKAMRAFLVRPQGMVLVTGPTGSGKTSTLYAALKSIQSPTNNIITLEDPIELQLEGVNQMQVNPKAGLTFASGLRSVLRQDPNVVLVGEIRDAETAGIALQAAQTGHLLLSTLHTNDAPATITRLLDLDVQPFIVASSLVGILGQRLVRRVCSACAEPQEPTADVVETIGGPSRLPADGKWTAGRGCEQCNKSGFKGRLAIHEVLTVDDEVRALISSRASEQEIRAAARRSGMRTMLEDGLDKAAQGLTTIEELLSVVPAEMPTAESRPMVKAAAPVAAPTSVAPQASAPPQAVAAPATKAEGSTARRRVLVVEDSPTIVSVIQYFLELEGFDVMVAGDGRTGLHMALEQIPDVIVSDVNMPMMTGVEMVRALRSDPRASRVRILMLTSEDSVETETAGLEAGADDYILKPVEPRRLAARVKALLTRAH